MPKRIQIVNVPPYPGGKLALVNNRLMEHPDPPPASRQLLKAFASGDVTVGGMAEAGWRDIYHRPSDRGTTAPDADA